MSLWGTNALSKYQQPPIVVSTIQNRGISSFVLHELWHSTVLESITGWVEKSLNSSKMVLNPSYWLPGVLIIQILYLDLFLDLFWTIFGLRRPKNVQNIFFKNVDFLLLVHSNVMSSFKVYNWCIGLFNHSLWLSGVFRNWILFLDLFLNLFLANFGLRRQKMGDIYLFFQNLIFHYFWLVLE